MSNFKTIQEVQNALDDNKVLINQKRLIAKMIDGGICTLHIDEEGKHTWWTNNKVLHTCGPKTWKVIKGLHAKDNHVGVHLVELRRSLGVTQYQMAKRLKVSQVTVTRMERGERVPSAWLLRNMLMIGIDINSYLFRLPERREDLYKKRGE